MVRPRVWHLILLFPVLLLHACNRYGWSSTDTDKKKLASDSIFIRFKEQPILYADWQRIYKHKDNAFSLDSFSYISQYSNDFIYTLAKLQKDYFKKYERFFVYRIDSEKFIDPFSNALVIHADKRGKLRYIRKEEEQEVAMIDVKTKKRYRIFFCGSPCFISHASWITDDKIALMGITTEDENDSYIPTIWLIDMKKNTTAEYSYSDPIPGITPSMLLDSILTAKGVTR